MLTWKRAHTIALAGICLSAAAFFAGRAVAAGIPSVEPLTYSGTLEGTNGNALTGDHVILLRLWDAASAGNVLCTRDEETVTLQAGRFSLTLPDDCTADIKSNPDTWVEVVVDSVSLGRAKVGAVPYAVESDHAVTANGAAPGSPLDATLQDLTAKATAAHVSIVSGFSDVRINSGNATAGAWSLVPGRSLAFNKRSGSSLLKVTYQDTLGRYGDHYNGCRWRLKLGSTVIASFSAGDQGDESPNVFGWNMQNASHVAWHTGAAAGDHTVSVEWAGGSSTWTNVSECLAGWNTTGNFLSVEEIP